MPTIRIYALIFAALSTIAAWSAAQADSAGIVAKDSMAWNPAPAALPAGAKIAALYGDPSQGGPFVVRIQLPKGYKVPPHKHHALEMLTVISGDVRYGMGQRLDPAAENIARAGDFIVTPAETGHWVIANDDAVLQLSSIGPFEITYLDPNDDPRAGQR